MIRLDYTAQLSDGPALIFPDVECELDISTECSGAEFDMTVVAVLIDGADLLKSRDAAFKAIGLKIAAQAEEDDDLINAVMTAEGISYRGLGGNDPDGHFVRRAA